jgi:hypothetical protein
MFGAFKLAKSGGWIRLPAVALVAAALLLTGAAPAAAQRPPNILIDDPHGELGFQTRAVVDAAVDLVGSGKPTAKRPRFIVSVVRSRRGRSLDRVAARRFAKLAPRGPRQDLLLLLVVDDRAVHLTVRSRRALAKEEGRTVASIDKPLRRASRAGTRRYRRTGTEGAAALDAIRAFPSPSSSSAAPGKEALTWLFPPLLLLGLFGLVRGVRARMRLRGFAGGVVAIANLRPGTAMVTGTVVADPWLISPSTGAECVYWEVSVKEDYQKVRVEHEETDYSLGSRRTYREEVETGIGTFDHGTFRESTPFWVRDKTGGVYVVPDKADFKPKKTFSKSVRRGKPGYDAYGLGEVERSVGVRQVDEAVIPLNEEVTVVGPAEVGPEGAQIVNRRRLGTSPRHPFLVTVDNPQRAQRRERRRMFRNFALAALCAIAMVVITVVLATDEEVREKAAAGDQQGAVPHATAFGGLPVNSWAVFSNGLPHPGPVRSFHGAPFAAAKIAPNVT